MAMLYKNTFSILVATALTLVATGCGSSENGAGDDPNPTPTASATNGEIAVTYSFVLWQMGITK